jgi:hypothetical protein
MSRVRHKKNKFQLVFALPKTDLPQKKRRKLKKINWKPWFWGGFFILFLAGTIYFFVFSPVFKIMEIGISGNNLISSNQIQAVAKNVLQRKFLNIIPRDTVFALMNVEIRQELFNEFPEIATVEIKMEKIGSLSIAVSERKTAAIVCKILVIASLSPTPTLSVLATSTSAAASEAFPESEGCFFVDEGGLAYRESPEISGTILPTFYSQDVQLRPRSQALDPSAIEFATQIKKKLREIGVDLPGFILNDEINQELKAFTSEGWLIYFDLTRSALTQARVLEILLKDEIKDKRATLQYVDLRVADRVYYK